MPHRAKSLTVDGLESKSFTRANSYSCNEMTELQNCKQREREMERHYESGNIFNLSVRD